MQRIGHENLKAFSASLVEALGASRSTAEDVATSLVEADLRGHASHGVVRLLTTYEPMVEAGLIDPEAKPSVTRRTEGAATVDGNHAFGHVTGREAVGTGLGLLENSGVSVVGVKNASHLGRVGEWAEVAAESGVLVSILVNTGGTERTVTVPGSVDRLFATNPIAFGIPTFDEIPFPIVLDIATSQVAHGKVTKRAIDKGSLPQEWTVTQGGEHVASSEEFEKGEGALLPLGGRTAGHKGYGLAVIAELCAGIVGGGAVIGQEAPQRVNNSAMFVFVDPLLFGSREHITSVIRSVKNQVNGASRPSSISIPPTMKGGRTMLPGEAEFTTYTKRIKEGVPVTEETAASLTELASELGVERSL